MSGYSAFTKMMALVPQVNASHVSNPYLPGRFAAFRVQAGRLQVPSNDSTAEQSTPFLKEHVYRRHKTA
jgi:hypothetical protein